MTTSQTSAQAVPHLIEAPAIVLSAPEALSIPTPQSAAQMIKPDQAMMAKVDVQLASYIDSLMQGDPNSEAFRDKVDQAFSLGNEQIAAAATVSNRFTKMNMKGIEGSHAFKAVADLRSLFEELNPAREGDLFAPTKVFGIAIPGMSKVNAYFRRYESADKQMDAIVGEVETGRDEIARDIAELKVAEIAFYDAIQKLTGAEAFLMGLDAELSRRIDDLRATDPERAKAFEQEILYYARKNLENVVTLKGVTIISLLNVRNMQKTGRETMRGCNEMMTIGRAAMSQAVMLARATGNQIAVNKMLQEGKKTIRDLLDNNAKAFGDHVAAIVKDGAEPVVMGQQLQRLFDQTLQATDILDKFRSEALVITAQNTALIQSANASALKRIETERAALSSSAATARVLDI